MARRLAAAVVMLVAGLGLLVAAVGADEPGESRKGGTLRLATFDEAGVSLDTGLAYANWAWVPIHATCAKLFTLDDAGADGLRVVPEVVDDLDVSRDRRTYTFALKQSFRFSTGARVTARSVADAVIAQRRLAGRSPGRVTPGTRCSLSSPASSRRSWPPPRVRSPCCPEWGPARPLARWRC